MIEVNIKEYQKSYPIFFDNSDLSNLKNTVLQKIGSEKYVIVISKKVFNLYKNILNFDKTLIFILPDGEKEKNIKNYYKILDFCSKKGLTRDSYIVAIGGGVVGDITGFVASTYMRGINLIQVPTTLLACVDSSVGGKTAINTPFGKNIVGAFYQPSCVIINPNFLKSLDLKNIKCGLGEIIKYGIIENSCLAGESFGIINFLNEKVADILQCKISVLADIVRACIKLKVSVVEKDEKESGLRRILNLGHTYGHAIEKYTNFSKYSHGECVVEGIRFAFEIARKNNLVEDNYYYIIQDLLNKYQFKQFPSFELKKLISIMKTDKKSTSDYIRFILPVGFASVKEFKLNDFLTIF